MHWILLNRLYFLTIYLILSLFIGFMFQTHHIFYPFIAVCIYCWQKEALELLDKTASQIFQKRLVGLWELQATAVNTKKDLFFVDLLGSIRVKTVCLASVRCDNWYTLYQLCGLRNNAAIGLPRPEWCSRVIDGNIKRAYVVLNVYFFTSVKRSSHCLFPWICFLC